MKYSDESYHLRIELDTKHFELSAAQIEHLEDGLDPLRKPVEKFPVADLYITIEFHERSNDYRVKTVLQLPGRGLATGDVDKAYAPAFDRCVRKLLHKLIAYEDELGREEDRTKHVKGTRHDVTPNREIDIDAVRRAFEQNDFGAFRNHLMMYEESLHKRIGRWIQRYPVLEAQLGERFNLADIVEEVYLNAFERFGEWPTVVPLGTWLEQLIDPSLKLLGRDSMGEMQNISFARTLREADVVRQAEASAEEEVQEEGPNG